ncbi:MAG TPA: cytochrome c [Kofleriaceae bacterium]
MRTLALVVVFGCGSTAPPVAPAEPVAPPAITILDAVKYPIELAVEVYRWRCTIRDAKGLGYDELYVPAGREIRLRLKDIDRDPLDVEIATKHVTLEPRGGTGEILFSITAPGRFTWKCPTELPPPPKDGTPPDVELPLVAMSSLDFEAFRTATAEQQDPTTPEGRIALGKRLYEKKGCTACHTIDGTPRVGPSWKGIWNTTVHSTDGREAVVDATYVTESVLHPQAFLVQGYPPTMPSFENQLKPGEVAALVAYIQSLGAP